MKHPPLVICPKISKCFRDEDASNAWDETMTPGEFCTHAIPHTKNTKKGHPLEFISPCMDAGTYCPRCVSIRSKRGKSAYLEFAKAAILGIKHYIEINSEVEKWTTKKN